MFYPWTVFVVTVWSGLGLFCLPVCLEAAYISYIIDVTIDAVQTSACCLSHLSGTAAERRGETRGGKEKERKIKTGKATVPGSSLYSWGLTSCENTKHTGTLLSSSPPSPSLSLCVSLSLSLSLSPSLYLCLSVSLSLSLPK